MKHIVVQPSLFYYLWQVEVLIFNLIEMGVEPNQIHIVCSKNEDFEIWKKMSRHYNKVKFFFYDDTRVNSKYISSIRPHLLEKHFQTNAYLEKETIFYHDCDVIFTEPLNYEKYLSPEDKDWYLSDTISYIGYKYIISKGEEIFNKMIDIVNIDPQLVIDNQNNSGGAQYVIKNVNADFWRDVYNDCENLFYEITKLNREIKSKNPTYHELQIWCADMWALLWNAWKRGIKTNIDKDLDFSWGTTPSSQWDKFKIHHNAGIIDNKNKFYKYDFRKKLPYYTELEVNKNICNYKYYEYVKKVGLYSVIKWL